MKNEDLLYIFHSKIHILKSVNNMKIVNCEFCHIIKYVSDK